eukprot:XP_019920717.1 PREDICTED: scavenger receptor class F member 1 isoform X3 [Crassostrea gigas]
MASILYLGFAVVVALASGVDAQSPRRCSSFPRDTCPVGYNCVNGYCEESSSPFPCRSDFECPRDYECIRGQCVRRPRDCRVDPFICQPFGRCNQFTGRCETGQDCRRDPFICNPSEVCNRQTGRCDQSCRFNPSICGPFQTCNFRTGRCESEPGDCRTFQCPPGQSCQYRFGTYQCVQGCRPFPARDCPRGFYCRRGECVRDFLRAAGSISGGDPATGTEAADTGSGM